MNIDFPSVLAAVELAGYGDDVPWAENLHEPKTVEHFALEVIFVICNSGMRFTVARGIYDRVEQALQAGESAGTVFGHKGKCAAIDSVWRNRAQLLGEYLAAPDKLAFLAALPWIGHITKYHLAKNFGLQYAKPDVHLQRLADAFQTTPQALCEELAARHGLKVATIDTVLWRAAAIGALNTATGKLNDEN
jgi:hypothetical protein